MQQQEFTQDDWSITHNSVKLEVQAQTQALKNTQDFVSWRWNTDSFEMYMCTELSWKYPKTYLTFRNEFTKFYRSLLSLIRQMHAGRFNREGSATKNQNSRFFFHLCIQHFSIKIQRQVKCFSLTSTSLLQRQNNIRELIHKEILIIHIAKIRKMLLCSLD